MYVYNYICKDPPRPLADPKGLGFPYCSASRARTQAQSIISSTFSTLGRVSVLSPFCQSCDLALNSWSTQGVIHCKWKYSIFKSMLEFNSGGTVEIWVLRPGKHIFFFFLEGGGVQFWELSKEHVNCTCKCILFPGWYLCSTHDTGEWRGVLGSNAGPPSLFFFFT